MDDAGEGSRATRRQVLGATAGALAVGALPGRGAAQADGGDLIWEFETSSHVDLAGPTVVNNTVYFGSDDDNVYAVDAETGTEQWRFDTGGDVNSAPFVTNGTLYAGTGHHEAPEATSVYAIDAATGTEQWEFETDDAVRSSPTVVDGNVFVGSDDGNVYALDASTGVEQWRFETGDGVGWCSPTVVGGTLFIGSQDNNLYAIETETGGEQWRFDGAFGDSYSSPTVVNETVYAGNNDDSVYAIDASDGTGRWRYETTQTYVQSSPTVFEDTVYIGIGGTTDDDPALHAIDAETGTREWKFDTGGHVHPSPTVAGGRVFVGSGDNNVYALDADDGSEYWRFETGDKVWSSPIVYQGTVYVGSDDFSLYALDAGVPGSSEGSRVRLGTRGHLDERADRVTTVAPAFFEVSIESVTESTAGETLDVTVAVENTGDASGEQTIELSAFGLGTDSTTVSLDGGEDTTKTLSLSTDEDEDDDGEYTLTVDTGDDSTQQTVTVLAPAAFTVDIEETTTPVEGGSLDVTVAVENTGDSSGTQTVALSVPGLGSDSREVSLDGGDSATETLSILTETGDAGEYDATIEAGDGSDSTDVTVLAPAAFTVEITDTNNPVAGGPLNVSVAVENTGDETGTQTVELSAPGLGSDSVEVEELDGGSSTTEELSLSTGEGDAGEYTVTAQTDNDEATATATVSEPAGDGDTGSPGDGTGAGGDDGNTPDDSTSGDDSTDPIDDGNSTGDGGLGTTEMAAIGGGGGLALLFGAYALMRRSGDDDSDSTSESTPDASTGGESFDQPSPSPGPDRGATRQRGRSDAGGVPSRIPDTPRPSLSYEDITIGDPLGRGGNADVYYATAATPQGDLKLAVKEPRMGGGETLDTRVVERMMDEAETWEQLDGHDHVAGVVDYGTQPLPWIAMEYMNGGHLGERADEMGTTQKLWTVLSVTEGVYHAHNRGIAHRDLKPENILFRRVDGAWDAPKVADWGLSKHLLEHSKSRDGMTVEYAAPEQFSDSRSTDDRTDIYQLGAVFYELFTGRPPFEGEMFAVMEQIKTETPTPPSAIADVPDGLDEILLRALAKNSDDRYSDILYMRDDLQELFEASR